MKSRKIKNQIQYDKNMITEYKSGSTIDLFGKSKVSGGYAPVEDDENSDLFGKILINKPIIPDWKKIPVCY